MGMDSPYIIMISSQKGGVGKTTVAVNLAVALRLDRYKVLLVDADYLNPSVGFILGLENINTGIRSVLNGKSSLDTSISVHAPTGLHVLGGELSYDSDTLKPDELASLMAQLKASKYDFIVIDTPPGFYPKEVIDNISEALIVSTPEMASVVSAVRLAHKYEKKNLRHTLLLNMVKGKRYELSIEEIEDTYGTRVGAIIPLDEIVPISSSERIPAFIYGKRSEFVGGISKLAGLYSGQPLTVPKSRQGIFAKLLSLFKRKRSIPSIEVK